MDLKNILGYIKRPKTIDPLEEKLNRITDETTRYIINIKRYKKQIKILYGPAFSIYIPCFVHDTIFSNILRIHGAEIVPIYCDSIQHVECNVYGGVWGGGKNFKKNCANCAMKSRHLWSSAAYNLLKFSSFITRGERIAIYNIVRKISEEKWMEFSYQGLSFGQWAKDTLLNNYVVGDYHLVNNSNKLGKIHISNLLLLNCAYSRILQKVKPDRVITNDSYYGMWALMQRLCQERSIPFYSHWSGTRKGAWCYAYNDASLNLNFSPSWKNFAKIPLKLSQKKKVTKWLDERCKGKDMVLDAASIQTYKSKVFNLEIIKKNRPIALLLANVVWDQAALNKETFFKGMMEWIVETIHWFSKHSEYQLIIKPHPIELHPAIPKTQESVLSVLQNRRIEISSNVIILPSDVQMTAYQLFDYADVGLVYTSTSGIEMSARGIPVITAGSAPFRGLGFTVDPGSKKEYEEYLKNFLTKSKKRNNKFIDLAYKYILFNFFHYYTKIDIMDNSFENAPVLKVGKVEDILPGKNKYLDYIANSIMRGLPILSENRWPPES